MFSRLIFVSILSVAVSLPEKIPFLLNTNKLSSVSKTLLSSHLRDDDIHLCGFYSTNCIVDGTSSIRSNTTLQGQPGADPTSMVSVVEGFLDRTCTLEDTSLFLYCNLTVSNDVSKSYNMGTTGVDVRFSEQSVDNYNCTQPIVAGTLYNILTLECVNSQGEDPFEGVREMIGTIVPTTISFNSTAFVADGDTFYYINDQGCTDVPTTIPPTQTPTEPPTQTPTQTPTEPPTEPPTQTPTEPPKPQPNWNLIIYICIGVGGVLILIIIIWICCCCCKKCKSKGGNSRVRRVVYNDKAPLKTNYA